ARAGDRWRCRIRSSAGWSGPSTFLRTKYSRRARNARSDLSGSFAFSLNQPALSLVSARHAHRADVLVIADAVPRPLHLRKSGPVGLLFIRGRYTTDRAATRWPPACSRGPA